jgi:hypothetical protein
MSIVEMGQDALLSFHGYGQTQDRRYINFTPDFLGD